MSSLRHLARQLNVSRTTVSAALRGHSWVAASTRLRVIQCAERHGYFHPAASTTPLRGMISILRLTSGAQRRRVAVDRHRAISRAAKESANDLGYAAEDFVIEAEGDALERLLAGLKARDFGGVLVLPGANLDLLRRVGASGLPCVYADIPPDEISVDAVSPDYHQGLHLALGRLREAGFRKPGLVLDNDLPLATRERLVSAYGSALAPNGASSPSPFFTPTFTTYHFEIWLRRHAFDCLLATDSEHVRRLSGEGAPPVFGMRAEIAGETGGLCFNFPDVGWLAIETIHNRITRKNRSVPPARLLVPASWIHPQWIRPRPPAPCF